MSLRHQLTLALGIYAAVGASLLSWGRASALIAAIEGDA